MTRLPGIIPMEIRKIHTPVTGKTEDSVMHRYALYFANKLEVSLLGVHALFKPAATGKMADGTPFASLIKDCQDCGIALETRLHHECWETAFTDAGPEHLVILPFGRCFRLPGVKLEDNRFIPSRQILCCPDHYIDIESIALTYDGSDNAKRALDLAVWLSGKAVWPLSVLMVVENQEQGVYWMDEVEAFLDTLAINSTSIILSGPAEKALHRFMQEGSVELLIMGTSGQRTHQAGSLGSTAAAMLKAAHYPLLMVS